MTIIKKSFSEAPRRRPDAAMEIVNLFSEPEARFSLVVGSLDGAHGKNVNSISERAYFILEGQGTVFVGTESCEVKAWDLVYIPPGAVHGIKGKMKALIFDTPPFSPNDEKPSDDLI